MGKSGESGGGDGFSVYTLSKEARSAYFARREAAKVLRCVIRGDSNRRAVASIKSLIFNSSVRNKKATFALVCQTLKYLSVIESVLKSAQVINGKWKMQMELMYTVAYDVLFGPLSFDSLVGAAERYLFRKKDVLQSSLARFLVSKGVKCVEELIPFHQSSYISRPRYVRVNTLKLDSVSTVLEFGKKIKNFKIQMDNIVPDLLVLPPGIDLHDHPLVLNGSVFMQGRASSMVAVALDPKSEWVVVDACAAPGNKTTHLASLMKGKGKVIACELNLKRLHRLEETVRLSGAANIEILHQDFLNVDFNDHAFSQVRAVLLDPSCSGSGTAFERMDHLLPSSAMGGSEYGEIERLKSLAAFQRKALIHALSFPAVERVVYSTCSIHEIENEGVIKNVLPFATERGFRLGVPFPDWPRRGLPVVDGSECLLRMDMVEDKEGFFMALFVREMGGSTAAVNFEDDGSCGGDGILRNRRNKGSGCDVRVSLKLSAPTLYRVKKRPKH